MNAIRLIPTIPPMSIARPTLSLSARDTPSAMATAIVVMIFLNKTSDLSLTAGNRWAMPTREALKGWRTRTGVSGLVCQRQIYWLWSEGLSFQEIHVLNRSLEGFVQWLGDDGGLQGPGRGAGGVAISFNFFKNTQLRGGNGQALEHRCGHFSE